MLYPIAVNPVTLVKVINNPWEKTEQDDRKPGCNPCAFGKKVVFLFFSLFNILKLNCRKKLLSHWCTHCVISVIDVSHHIQVASMEANAHKIRANSAQLLLFFSVQSLPITLLLDLSTNCLRKTAFISPAEWSFYGKGAIFPFLMSRLLRGAAL